MKLIPKKEQWNSWSLPSKATYIGVIVGLISFPIFVILGSISLYFSFYPRTTENITPQENEALSPKLSVKFDTFLDDIIYPSPYEYPLKEYLVSIVNNNRQSVPVLNLYIEFFFNNTITQASYKIIPSGASGTQIYSLRYAETKNGKTTYTELPAESPINEPATSLKIEKERIDEELANTNISHFNCPAMTKDATYQCQFLVDLTKAPTLRKLPDLMGKYFCKYSYQIKGNQFSGEVNGVIPAAKTNLLKAKLYVKSGDRFLQSNQFDKAVPEFDRAIELYPQYVYAYSERGYAFLMLNQNEKAILDCDTALDYDPKCVNALFNRAGAKGNLKRYDEAIQDYDTYITIKPDDPEGYYARGLAYGRMGQNQDAMSDFDKAIELNPNHGMAYLYRGVAYELLGYYDNAISEYRIALELNPKIRKEIIAKISAAQKKASLSDIRK